MNYRKLGSTDLLVSEVGFGAWGIGGDAYGPTDDAESKLALETAYVNGINFYDTANIYGAGHSEELIGKVFEKVRHEIVIATKGGSLYHTQPPVPQDFSPEHLRSALEASLRRLRTDYIDVYQLHSPPVESIPDALDALIEFKKEGKIRSIGISVTSPSSGLDEVKRHNQSTDPKIDIIQTNFSMIDQRASSYGLIYSCKESGLGFIARTPLCFGFLSEGVGILQTGDHRLNWSEQQISKWRLSTAYFEHLYGNRTHSQFALGFILAHDAISTTIPGMMRIEEVLENIRSVALSDDEVEEIRKIYNQHEFFLGER